MKTAEKNVALYRKYRPSSFDEVLGQDHIVKVLTGAIERGNIAHAYIFAGSRGTGKTSIARILAQEIGSKGNDISEIDGASNRGIDEARAIREAVHTLPFESPYKVYIVDEAHMLTRDAWNALLKTLEEPPTHVVFVFATTELEKIPETIISRCQTFVFKKPTQEILKEVVTRIAKKEGTTLPVESAELIAFLAEGSFRDAQGILQKVLSSTDQKSISIEEVELVTGAPKGALVNACIEAFAKGDTDAVLTTIDKANKENIAMEVFLKLILHKVRSILLLRYAPSMKDEVLVQFPDSDQSFLISMTGKEGAAINSKLLLALLESSEQMAFSPMPSLPLQLVAVRLKETVA